MKVSRSLSTSEGSILVAVLAMLLVLTVVIGSVLSSISQEYVLSKRSLAWNQALFTAETGVEFGWNEVNKLTAINTNSAFMSGSSWTFLGNGQWRATNQVLTGSSGTEASTFYQVIVNTNNWTITATGAASSSLIDSAVTRTVIASLKPTTPFEWAILAKGNINFNGKQPLVDSWDSILDGAYDPSGSNRRANGSVGTNGQTVDLAGSTIYGSVMNGPGASPPAGNSYTIASIAGRTRNQPTNEWSNGLEVYIPDVIAPWAKGTSGVPTATAVELAAISGTQMYEMGNVNGSLNFQGSGTVILYVDSINQTGGDSLTITPSPAGSTLNVIIYSQGDVKLTGNSGVNANGNAINLQVYGLPTCDEVDLGGTSDTRGAFYAPNAAFTFHGTGEFFGSFTGNTVTVSGTPDFHYDEVLDSAGNIIGFSLLAWREQ